MTLDLSSWGYSQQIIQPEVFGMEVNSGPAVCSGGEWHRESPLPDSWLHSSLFTSRLVILLRGVCALVEWEAVLSCRAPLSLGALGHLRCLFCM